MSKRGSGAPRHPRNPVAKAVRTPAFKQQVVPDKRWKNKLKQVDSNGNVRTVDVEATEMNDVESPGKD